MKYNPWVRVDPFEGDTWVPVYAKSATDITGWASIENLKEPTRPYWYVRSVTTVCATLFLLWEGVK